MIEACELNNVRLMTAYRLHFERANLEVAQIARSRQARRSALLQLQLFPAGRRRQRAIERRPRRRTGAGHGHLLHQRRAQPVRGGAARSTRLGGEPPQRMRASARCPKPSAAIMQFPKDRAASFTCSFGAADRSEFEIVGTKGSIVGEPIYEIAEGLGYTLRVGKRTSHRQFQKSDQFAPELIYFSDCVLEGRDPEPGRRRRARRRARDPGDHAIGGVGAMGAARPAAAAPPARMQQEIRRPGIQPPPMVNAASPSGWTTARS